VIENGQKIIDAKKRFVVIGRWEWGSRASWRRWSRNRDRVLIIPFPAPEERARRLFSGGEGQKGRRK
jgi:hypothetical protein